MIITKQNLPALPQASSINIISSAEKIKNIYYTVAKTLSLLLLFFIATSHESKNPKVGHTDVEFYLFETAGIIQHELQGDYLVKPSADTIFTTRELVHNFYKIRNYYPAWTINYKLLPCTDSLLKELRSARNYGLEPSLYKVSVIDSLTRKMMNEDSDSLKLAIRTNLELQLTHSFIEFSTHISVGLTYDRKSPQSMAFRESLPFIINNGINAKQVRIRVLSLQPENIEYVRLISAMARFIENVNISDDIVSLPKSSDTAAYYEVVKKSMIRFGYLRADQLNDSSSVNAAILKFKKLHGVQSKEIYDKEVQQCLSRSTKSLYLQLALNIDRLRRTRYDDGKYVIVNIPSYEMKIVENKKEEATFVVVVGKPTSPTPELSSQIQTVVTNPYWTVPKSITFNEILPRIKKDSTYLERNNFFLIDKKESKVDASTIDWENADNTNFNYWIRQNNTGSNALGVVKFLFPNNYQVYIHDTPSKKYFRKEMRAYSHGCVRLENPELFAKYLISEHYNSDEDILIDKVIKQGERKSIRLSNPLDVHFRYYTCEADENLDIHFYYDIYQRDKEEMEKMLSL